MHCAQQNRAWAWAMHMHGTTAQVARMTIDPGTCCTLGITRGLQQAAGQTVNARVD